MKNACTACLVLLFTLRATARCRAKAGAERQKSVALEEWAPILKTPGVTFVSLQYGDVEGEVAAFNATLGQPRTRDALAAFMSQGGQTREGELRLGELAGEL